MFELAPLRKSYMGVGFAIPSNLAKAIANRARRTQEPRGDGLSKSGSFPDMHGPLSTMITSSVIKLFSGTEMRTIIDLPDEQAKPLKSLASQLNLSRAELVRRAIADYVARNRPSDDDDAAFGIWQVTGEDGLDYQARLRSEWEK